jgi:hypothetical protein
MFLGSVSCWDADQVPSHGGLGAQSGGACRAHALAAATAQPNTTRRSNALRFRAGRRIMRRGTVIHAGNTSMRSIILRPALISLLVSACAARAPSSATPLEDRNTLTQAQLIENGFANAFEAVQALRPTWLQTRGASSLIAAQAQVLVYLDDTRLGGTETLRSIITPAIVAIRHIDGIAATGRWGLDHGQGVILVTTFR